MPVSALHMTIRRMDALDGDYELPAAMRTIVYKTRRAKQLHSLPVHPNRPVTAPPQTPSFTAAAPTGAVSEARTMPQYLALIHSDSERAMRDRNIEQTRRRELRMARHRQTTAFEAHDERLRDRDDTAPAQVVRRYFEGVPRPHSAVVGCNVKAVVTSNCALQKGYCVACSYCGHPQKATLPRPSWSRPATPHPSTAATRIQQALQHAMKERSRRSPLPRADPPPKATSASPPNITTAASLAADATDEDETDSRVLQRLQAAKRRERWPGSSAAHVSAPRRSPTDPFRPILGDADARFFHREMKTLRSRLQRRAIAAARFWSKATKFL